MSDFCGREMQDILQYAQDIGDSGFHTGGIAVDDKGAAESVNKYNVNICGFCCRVCADNRRFAWGYRHDAQGSIGPVDQPQLFVNLRIWI